MNEETMKKRISDLENRVSELEKMISFITDVKNSEKINEYLNAKKRVLNTSNLINRLTEIEKINIFEQWKTMTRLENENISKKIIMLRISDNMYKSVHSFIRNCEQIIPII